MNKKESFSRKNSSKNNKAVVTKKTISDDWKDSLSITFLRKAANGIKFFNYVHKTPIIYSENGVIYKVVDSEKIELGKIKTIKRKIKENCYTIE